MSSTATEQWPAEANVGEPWTDKSGRVRQPAVMHEAGDGTVTYGQTALRALVRDIDEARESNRRTLQRLTPLQVRQLEQRLATGRWPVSRPKVNVGVAFPRRTNGPSGRPRQAATRSSAKSGDSPDEGPSASRREVANGNFAKAGAQ